MLALLIALLLTHLPWLTGQAILKPERYGVKVKSQITLGKKHREFWSIQLPWRRQPSAVGGVSQSTELCWALEGKSLFGTVPGVVTGVGHGVPSRQTQQWPRPSVGDLLLVARLCRLRHASEPAHLFQHRIVSRSLCRARLGTLR